MSDTRYNGWTNYETWNLALWLDNEQDSHRYWRQCAQDAYDDATSDEQDFTRDEVATLDLAKHLQDEVEANAPEVEGFYADVLNAAIGQVNWYEIAEHYIADVDKDTEE